MGPRLPAFSETLPGYQSRSQVTDATYKTWVQQTIAPETIPAGRGGGAAQKKTQTHGRTITKRVGASMDCTIQGRGPEACGTCRREALLGNRLPPSLRAWQCPCVPAPNLAAWTLCEVPTSWPGTTELKIQLYQMPTMMAPCLNTTASTMDTECLQILE